MQSSAFKADPTPALRSTATLTEDDLAPARALVARGEDVAAQHAYLALLARDPTHFQCLTEFAKLVFTGGFRSAARTAYEQAVLHHPHEPMAHVNLANILQMSNEPVAAKRHYLAALKSDPAFAHAHQGLALVLQDEGDLEAARFHRDMGFSGNALVRRPYRGAGKAISVLQLVSARGGNVPTDGLLNDLSYDVTSIYAEYFDLQSDLPAHDVVFNAIGDADLCRDALGRAIDICGKTDRPVLNWPARVVPTGRADTAARLGSIPNVRTACVRVLPSSTMREMEDITFPILIRRPGYHTGQHFHRIDTRIALIATLDAFDKLGPGDLLMIDYMDARGADGMARKYRVMFIDGRLYPLHLAISHDWKVHYFTAAMADDAAYRAEEQRFLDDPAAVLGLAGIAALQAIADRLGLDYAGIDFGLADDGTILVFEVNATMVLIPPSPDPVWDYRRLAIGQAFQAVADMLTRRLTATG
jgi:hypothetical protein